MMVQKPVKCLNLDSLLVEIPKKLIETMTPTAFLPVLKSTSLRFIFIYVLENGLIVRHIDVKTAFLNVPLEFENYMEMPKILVKEFGVPPLVKLLQLYTAPKMLPYCGGNYYTMC